MRLYGEMAFALARNKCKSKEDAEDVCQDVFYALLRRTEPFKNDEHMKAWIIRAITHRSKNTYRYDSRHPRIPYDPTLHDNALVSEEAKCHAKLHDAINALTPEMQETLRLYYRDGYSTKEIASQKGVEESSIRARLHRARKKIAAGLTCFMVALLCFSTCISLPISPVPAALAIDFAVDESVSPQDLPVKAVQRTNENTALVTFTVDLSWKMDGIERVTYTIDADNVKIYAPGIGNYYMANDGELGSTKDAVQSKNGQAALPLNIEVVVPSTEAETNDELCTLAYNALEGKSIIAVAYFHDGSTETSDCLFAR